VPDLTLQATAIEPEEAAQLFAQLHHSSGILCAVSGGPDSIALLGLLANWCSRAGIALACATIDHGLRPESALEAEAVAQLCQLLNVPHRILQWQGSKPSTGLQKAARNARYALLGAEAARLGCSHVTTAHTLDDQAETVMMRLAHGSGLDGLAGMKMLSAMPSPHAGITLARPLLTIAKTRLIATCTAHDWPCVQDPSNENLRFERVRWRKLMPLLAAEGLTPERLATFAARNQSVTAALDWEAERWLGIVDIDHAKGKVMIDMSRYVVVPTAILTRFLLRAVPLDSAARPQRLERYERLAERLHVALTSYKRLRTTISGRMLTLDRSSTLTIEAEPPRQRGRGAKA
jgi:tRNA(Ile)-lysidine synthase